MFPAVNSKGDSDDLEDEAAEALGPDHREGPREGGAGERNQAMKERVETLKERVDTGFEQTRAKLELLDEKWSFLNEIVKYRFGILKEKKE